MKRFLVVVDMQKDFVDGALGTAEAREMVPRAVKKILDFDGMIFVTLDTHGKEYMETAEGKKLPVPHCIRGTEGWALDARIAAALKEKNFRIVEKNTFGSVDLPLRLRQAAGDELFSVEFIGLCTDICVVSNALLVKAYFPEAQISADASCCAGVTPELHRAALMTMKSCQIDVKGE